VASADIMSANTLEAQDEQICRAHCRSHRQRQLGMQPRISSTCHAEQEIGLKDID
jgi:hypothetical protein